MDKRIAGVIRSDILSTTAYQVADAGDSLKLDAMESPFKLTGELLQDWLDKLSRVSINRYPDPVASNLKAPLKARLNIPPDQDIMFGNGSDELIQILIQAVADDHACVFAPSPSFVMYKTICDWNRVEFISCDLEADFSLNLEATIQLIEARQPKLIFLAQPNNPTANLWNDESLRKILEVAKGLVVIDEAYALYSERSHLEWVSRYDNLAVIRTFSKQGFAGARLGYLVAEARWVAQLDKLRMPYNVGVLSQATGEFITEHWRQFLDQAVEIKAEREWVRKELTDMGFEVFPSQANFLVVRSTMSGNSLVTALRNLGVLVKNLCGSHPVLKNCIRITISTREENAQCLAALEHVLSDQSLFNPAVTR